ncbi:phosphomethylpyrimidine synthase [candidate division WOR-3 bacterium RBG_13_43_14]|uniref:Phosphomethylpyrimidine synthase n=1 Tax=candidate division WOR-3 bacterium RBG_13_43_14 TaxID=1802590 RepID=A0A1F4UB09_UNCW3|nr:MAG: phosphomethylpyrimidine synthase [candidate division WOR-3 bacterium RBG_13_43_14]
MNAADLHYITRSEGISLKLLKRGLASGTIVSLRNSKHKIRPLAVGKGMRTKINANIGTSPDVSNIKNELKKLMVAIEAGTDTVMDLSTGGNIDRIRREIMAASTVPIGTVPIYQVATEAAKRRRPFIKAVPDEFFDVIEKHLEDGVDFITVHCGVTRQITRNLKKHPRTCGVVSRGGSMLVEWMEYNRMENPLYEQYDRLCNVARKYNATLSLGDGLRPGSIVDSTDRYQIGELVTIGNLVKTARRNKVSVIVEGPGHVPINEIEANMKLQKILCDDAPFYVLGPLVTDAGAGYDHIVAAIGGALAAYYGADYLCYVTPSEHLGLPRIEEVREGVIAMKIAAHASDIAKGIKGARMLDENISRARYSLNWDKMFKLLIDPVKAKKIYYRSHSRSKMACTMCGEFCAMKKTKEVIKGA